MPDIRHPRWRCHVSRCGPPPSCPPSQATGVPRSPVGLLPYLRSGLGRTALTIPLIYSLLLPLALLDLWATLYQWACFPVYGIARVRRRHYLVMDRHRLPYLNAIEKVNCAFCAYGNGVLAYVREIAGRTEAYWCPIKHARPVRDAHTQYQGFFEHGDAAGYRYGLMPLRRGLRSAHRQRLPRQR